MELFALAPRMEEFRRAWWGVERRRRWRRPVCSFLLPLTALLLALLWPNGGYWCYHHRALIITVGLLQEPAALGSQASPPLWWPPLPAVAVPSEPAPG